MEQYYEQYTHHGCPVMVRKDLRGRHRDFCLCWNCANFDPTGVDNCPTAKKLYALCIEHNLVTPVFECPNFIVKVGG